VPPDLTSEIPADASIKGMWSAVHTWPLIPIHVLLLPDGRLLSYGTDANGIQTALFIYDVWTPSEGASNGHLTLPNGTGTDTFCSALLLVPGSGGQTLLAGGDVWDGTKTTNRGNDNSVLFSPSDNSLTRANDMNRPRWYATMTTLVNGQIYIQGGRDGIDRPEIRSPDGTFHLLSNIDTSVWDWYYPRNWVAPDGRVFGYESFGRMWYIDPTGDGTGVEVGRLPAENRGLDASAAMFAPGRILQFGGESNGAVVIDITSGTPVVTATQSMAMQRRYATATLLADGEVLATGGSSVRNELTDVSYNAEIWNPATGAWTVGASEAVPRLYHSTAILLPDASVLIGGGGAPGPLTNLNVETYYPPYLFTADGKLAPRPTIVTAPDAVSIGQTFTLDFANASAIAKVALVKTGAMTHNWNMDQRYVPLQYSANGNQLTVQMPTNAPDAPPGYYLLFVIDDAGSPSVGKIVRLM
jgi:Galactose oxidase-like, Early set domain